MTDPRSDRNIAQWPPRPVHPGHRTRRRALRQIDRRLPVTTGGPRPLPEPTLLPRTHRDALGAATVLVTVTLLTLALLSYSIARFGAVGIAGRLFIATIAILTLIAIVLYVLSLGLYVLPVLFRVRRPAPSAPPHWPDRPEGE